MRRLVRIVALTLMATLAVACAGPASSTSSGPSGGGSSSPQPTTQKQTKLVNVDAATAARLDASRLKPAEAVALLPTLKGWVPAPKGTLIMAS